MFYCPHCSNSYDIRKFIIQTGGNKFGSDIENDDMTSSLSSSTGGAISAEDILDNIINKVPITYDDIKQVGIDKITRHKDYKKLNKKNKDLVYNTIQDKLPKDKKKLFEKMYTGQKENQTAYFLCTNCGFSQPMKSGALIFSKGSLEDESAHENFNKDYKHHAYLPRTRKYICKNPKCESHKDPAKKEAQMHRLKNSYQMRYVCTTCNASWKN